MAVADPAWQASLNAFKKQLDGVRRDDALLPQGLCDAFRAFAEASKDDVNHRVFVLGQLGADKMIPVCRHGLIPWWPVFTGRVYQGDLEGMKKLRAAYEEDAGKGDTPNMSSALTWIVLPHKICDGFSNTINPKVIRQLFEWGADANHDNGKWLEFALRNLEAESIKPFLEHGAASGTILRVMDDLAKNQKFAQLGKIQDALAQCSHIKIDADTLLEAKYIPDARGGSMFKTLFNFSARRVHEIYEGGQGAQPVMTGMPFAEYDEAALKYAAEKLTQLGGKPRALDDMLDKPARPLQKGLQNGG